MENEKLAQGVKELRKENPDYTGKESFNYFLAVHFPDNQLTIIDYNRAVKDLNGLSKDEFIDRVRDNFDVRSIGKEQFKPSKLHEFGMYIDGEWYSLIAKKGTYNDNDPIECLDVTVLSKEILEPILDIKDLRKSTRIEFVGETDP